jgi:hypothetical protein
LLQTPPWHASPVVQALPSLQAVPSALLGLGQTPVDVLHVPAVWHWSRAVQVTGLAPVQTPATQVSVWVQALPSLQAVPSALLGLEQTPVDVLHVPAVWHWSRAVQVTGLAPVQVPATQVSDWVQALPSLQAVPSVLLGLEQTPVEVLHVPAVWHWSRAVQVTGLAPVQTPATQVSDWVQALPSLQVVPSVLLGLEHVPVTPSQVPTLWHWSRAVHVPQLRAGVDAEAVLENALKFPAAS